jgi:iron(II)-dependent oxidoreductase
MIRSRGSRVARTVLLGLTLWLSAASAQAARLMAVLPLDVSHTAGKLSPEAQAAIEEMLRDVASDALTAGGWTVLSTQNQLQLLTDNGVDATKCGEENCLLATAREIKSEKFISGAVQYSDGEFTASIRLIDTATGRIVSTVRVEGKTARDLRRSFESRSNAFFSKAGLVEREDTPPENPSGTSNLVEPVAPVTPTTGPKVKKGKVTASTAQLTVSSKPKDGVRLELTSPDGKRFMSSAPYRNSDATPGTWQVVARLADYDDLRQTFEVPADDETLIKLDLKRLGGLKITGTPSGSAVRVTGPGNFQDDGGLPWEAAGLKSGPYQIKVTRKGYAPVEQTAEVAPGETAEVSIALQKSAASPTTSGFSTVAPETTTEAKSGLEYIGLPGGSFTYGCEPTDSDCDREEKPGQPTKVAAFSMTKTEVTVEAYARCVDAGACSAADRKMFFNQCNTNEDDRLKHPVNCITYDQAVAFCTWAGGRLPTSEEWEYAAKGGESRIYPWGNDKPDDTRAIYKSRRTVPVGSFPAGASRHGILDLAGNVAEWTSTVRDNEREIRGASRDKSSDDMRASKRDTNKPDKKKDVVGFRCVR